MTSPSAQLMAEASTAEDAKSETALTTSTGGTKRKRGTDLKFYAVRSGHTPGIYHSWADCKAQITGFKNISFKSFTSLTEAEAFMKTDDSTPSNSNNPAKFYGVRNGRVPGVYTDWPSAQKQITGWTKPAHKKFSTRAEAEAFVHASPSDGTSHPDVHIDADASTPTLSSTNTDTPSTTKKLKTTKSKKETAALATEEVDGSKLGEPLLAPLPADAEDGFDRRVIMDPESGIMRWKTSDELSATKMMSKPDNYADSLHIYTDGACPGNGQKGAIAGVGVFFGPGDKRNLKEPLTGARQTNQRAELTAIKRALDICPLDRNVIIFSDSSYSINCVTVWFPSWRRKNWLTAANKPVENKDLVEVIVGKIEERKMAGSETHFTWLKGHADNPGNIAADKLAVEGAEEAKRILAANGR